MRGIYIINQKIQPWEHKMCLLSTSYMHQAIRTKLPFPHTTLPQASPGTGKQIFWHTWVLAPYLKYSVIAGARGT